MRLRDVFETINQGFAPRFWCQGNKQRSTQETNAKVVVAQKINLAFWSMLIHFWGTASNGECVCQRNFAVFYRGNGIVYWSLWRFFFLQKSTKSPDFWGVRQGNLSCFAVTSCPTSEDAKGKVSAVAHVLHAAPGETANFWRVQRISAALRRASAADAAGG